MSTRYPGGFINRSAPVIVGPTNGEGGSAPGVWTLEQASYYTNQGTWPQRIKDKPLFSWGFNDVGQLAQGDTNPRSSPVQVGSLVSWYSIGAGANNAYAVTASGSLWAWGKDNSGQIGINTQFEDKSSPVQVGALTTWAYVFDGGFNAAFAIKTDGSLWSWGNNFFGKLGQNNKVYKSSPVQVGSLTNWRFVNATYNNVIAIKTDGTLWAWGTNGDGQLGDGTVNGRSSPVQVGSGTTWLTASTGYNSSFATKTDGTLWAWGNNSRGQLGQNNKVYKSSPTQIGALTTWVSVASSDYAVLALKNDGFLWAVGNNADGQLGQNDRVNRSSPVQVGSLSSWSSIYTTDTSSMAIKTDGTLWVWGSNNIGQLGLGDITNRSSPVQVGLLNTWSFVTGGNGFVVGTQKI